MSIAEEVCDYSNLEEAYLEVTGYASEEKVINLQNHLIWGSYRSDGSVTDKVVMKAIIRVIIPESKPRHIYLTVAGGTDENHLVSYGLRCQDGEQRRA